ncbi:MAG: YihY/virulence factor BrkB family protein [Candidatus Abyssubacteria bacterium]
MKRRPLKQQKKIARLYEQFREADLSKSPAHVKILLYPGRVAIRAVEEFFADKCVLRASALAFATLLALVPVSAIFFFLFTKLEIFSAIKERVQDFLFRNLVPARTDIVREYLTQYTENIGVLGIFGVTTLLFAAIFLFNNIEHTINEIWHAKQRRPFLSKFTAFWTVLTATPLLVGVSFYIAAQLAARGPDVFSLRFRFLGYLLSWMAFWLMYQFVPYTHVRLRAALIGAVVGGTLWEMAKSGFNWYITNMATFDKVYGSLGTVPVFLIWVYLTWLIVLFGTEVAYAVQYHGEKTTADYAESVRYLDFYSVRAMAEIVKRFNDSGQQQTSTVDALDNIRIPPEVVGDILGRLSDKNLITFTEDSEYVPARHPSHITVREVIEAATGTKMLAPADVDDAISRRLKKAFEEAATGLDSALDGLSMQELVEQSKN